MTKSQAKALARSINLKPSDMPGYEASPPDKQTAADRADDAQLARCAGTAGRSKEIAAVSSDTFVKEDDPAFQIVGSSVRVVRSASVVRKDLKAWRTQRARNCLRAQILEAASADAPITGVDATTLHPGVQGVIAYRFTTHLTAGDPRDPLISDFFLFGRRNAEAVVIVNSHPDAPSSSQDDRLLRIVKTRMDTRLNPNAIL
jgi:hypothetical protein